MRFPRAALPAVIVLAALASACRSAGPKPPSTVPPPVTPGTAVPIMGASRLTAARLTAWFNSRQPRPSGVYSATVPVDALATIFIEEGAAEGVTGDVAFVQSIVETGWFRFGGTVARWMNNFGGIGVSDTNPSPAVFPAARAGVRAQIQHLRAYADPRASACAVPPLAFPCVDPRFNLVSPKGIAPNWNDLGNGRWATSSTYAASILSLYSEALAFTRTYVERPGADMRGDGSFLVFESQADGGAEFPPASDEPSRASGFVWLPRRAVGRRLTALTHGCSGYSKSDTGAVSDPKRPPKSRLNVCYEAGCCEADLCRHPATRPESRSSRR